MSSQLWVFSQSQAGMIALSQSEHASVTGFISWFLSVVAAVAVVVEAGSMLGSICAALFRYLKWNIVLQYREAESYTGSIMHQKYWFEWIFSTLLSTNSQLRNFKFRVDNKWSYDKYDKYPPCNLSSLVCRMQKNLSASDGCDAVHLVCTYEYVNMMRGNVSQTSFSSLD